MSDITIPLLLGSPVTALDSSPCIILVSKNLESILRFNPLTRYPFNTY